MPAFPRRIFYCFFTIALLFQLVCAGQAKRDSIFKVISERKDDSLKVIKLRKFCSPYNETDPEYSRKIYEYALSISRKIGNKSCESKCLLSLAILCFVHNQYDSARNYDWQALKAAKEAKNIEEEGRVYNNIANTYYTQNKLDSSAYYYMEALRCIEKTHNNFATSMVYGNLSNIFHEQHLNELSLKNALLSLHFAMKGKIDSNSTGVAYENCGIAYGALRRPDSQYYCYSKALGYYSNGEDLTNLWSIYKNLSEYEMDKKDYLKGKAYADSSLKYSRMVGNNHDIASALIHCGVMELKCGNISKAEQLLGDASVYVHKDMEWALLKEWNLQMAEIKRTKGDYKDALKYYDDYITYKDSVSNKESKEISVQMEAKYHSVKRQSQINELEKEARLHGLEIRQKNILLYILLGGFAIAIIISVMIYKNITQKAIIQKKMIAALEQEKQLVATKTILQAQESERSRMAKDLHDGLGGMLSGIKLNLSSIAENIQATEKDKQLFFKSMGQLDNAINEMRRVAHNMMPEALLKFGLTEAIKDFCETINESNACKLKLTHIGNLPQLEQSTEIIIYRIVQELVNNSIRHGRSKNIFIQLIKHEQGITVTVEDDGSGFDESQLNNIKGTGLLNVQSRVDYLKGSCEIKTEKGNGTSINIEIPV